MNVPEQEKIENKMTDAPVKAENFWLETLRFIIIAALIVFPVRYFIAEPFIVSGSSMDPTFANGQYLIVDQLTYRFESPKRGDVIVFKYPLDTSKYYIKRIIGLPGETVIMHGLNLTIKKTDGTTEKWSEPYVANTIEQDFTKTLKDDEYFVMGDNRPASSDSRIWGPLERKFITGRPIVRLFPFNKINVLPGEELIK